MPRRENVGCRDGRGGDSCRSLLNGINELTSGISTHRVEELDDSSAEETEEEKYSERFGSTEILNEDSLNRGLNEESLSEFDSTSLESSPSSLKRRLRDLPSPSEAIGLADHVAALDRRICRQRELFLQLQGITDRIEEKDEVETSSVSESVSIPKLLSENYSNSTLRDARARRRDNMCSSAPETMRLKKEAFEHALPNVATRFKTPLAKNFGERRPPKYLQPLEAPIKEILRCNAPPLCLSDKKIAEMLRRGSVSAREEYLKKSTKAPMKLAGYRKPTGVIIKNLSSGSEEDCTNQCLIRDTNVRNVDDSGFLTHRLDNETKLSIPEEIPMDKMRINAQEVEHREESEYRDPPRSSQTAKAVQKSSSNGETRLNEVTEVTDDLPSSRSGRLTKTSLQNSIAQFKSVLEDIDSNSRDSRPVIVPKLEITSQDYTQSTSRASREDSTKRSLDVGALIRALSDVSIKQQEFSDRKVQSCIRDSVVSRSKESTFSAYNSVTNGSRQSMVSAESELHAAKSNYLKSLHRSRESVFDDEKAMSNNGSTNALSRIPIAARETNDIPVSRANHRESRSIVRKKIVSEENDAPEREQTTNKTVTGSFPTKKSSKCRSTNFIEANKCSDKLLKFNSPDMKKSGKPRFSRISKTEATVREEAFTIAKNKFQSFDSLLQKREIPEKNPNVTNGPTAVLSEPGTSRNDRVISRDHLSSVAVAARGILPRVALSDQGSSDDRFKYLRQDSNIPYNRSSGNSCDSSNNDEEIEFKTKIISPSATGFQSADEYKSEAKFKIYEDTIEASPRSESTFPIEKSNNPKSSPPRTPNSHRELRRSESTSTHVNGLSVLKNSKISSPENFKNCKIWADSLGNSNQAIKCYELESRIEVDNDSQSPQHRSCLISPTACSKNQSNCSSKSSPRMLSNRLSIGSSGSPGCGHDEAIRCVGEKIASESFDDCAEKKFDNENIFPPSVVAKRLSYSELQNSRSKNENSDDDSTPERENFRRDHRDTSSPVESIDDLRPNSSRTNLAITGRSESTVDQFKKAFDRVATRAKMSSSLSKLTRSPNETNLGSRRRSQERFPFTISESTSAKSSSKLRADNAFPRNFDCATNDLSETAYKLRVHPSLFRLASAGIEEKPEDIIRSAFVDSVIRVERRNFVTKIVGRFSSKLKKSRKHDDKPGSGATKVLYENERCRAGSAEESSGSEAPERFDTRFKRDGLWVEGLRDESRFGSKEKNQGHDTEELSDSREQDLIDRYTNFLAERERLRRQFNGYGFAPKTPMNSRIINEDSNSDPGCFCNKICQFFIGGKRHSRNRSSLFLRARRYKLRRRF